VLGEKQGERCAASSAERNKEIEVFHLEQTSPPAPLEGGCVKNLRAKRTKNRQAAEKNLPFQAKIFEIRKSAAT
jgi:hypothetical protein